MSHYCPRTLVLQQDSVSLYHYHLSESNPPPENATININSEDSEDSINPRPPQQKPVLLLLYALVNRPTLLDLRPERSLIRRLLEQDLDVYLLDWGEPPQNKNLTLADYIQHYIHQAVEWLKHTNKLNSIHLMGICQGGYFALCYASLYPTNIAKLITTVAPVDFSRGENALSKALNKIDLDRLVAKYGDIPGIVITRFLAKFSPFKFRYQKLQAKLKEESSRTKQKTEQALYSALENWSFDSPRQAARAFLTFTKEGWQQNALVNNHLKLNKIIVSLQNITHDVLNIYAIDDHIWPNENTLALRDFIQSANYQLLSFQGGHLGVFISISAQKLIPNSIALFIGGKDVSPDNLNSRGCECI